MPVQLDIVGNLAKGAALREGVQRAGEERQARQLGNEGRRRALTAETGELPPEIAKLYDPYEFKLGQMFQGVFGSDARRERRGARALESQGYGTASTAMMTPGMDRMQQAQAPSALGMQEQYADGYADGGPVEDEEFSPVGEYAQAVGSRALDMVRPSNVVPNYLRESARTEERVGGAVEGFGGADARNRGRMIRDAAVEGGVGAYRQVGGFLQDVIRPAMPVIEGVKGALGFTGEVQAEPAASTPSATPEQAAAVQEQAPAEEPAPTESPSKGAGAATPRTALSQQFVGTPDPEQAAAQLGNIDLMPEEMPSMGTRDWVKYRAEVVPALMMQGQSAEEAHKSVSAMQHEGFLRYAGQAEMMLQSNNLKGAARALKAAYQYFPNGSDVKFGFQNGHLVGVGVNEETGEPQGKPQVITPEYLSAMRLNYEDPAKFLMWTKDWRDELFRDQHEQEIVRPEAQSNIDYRNRSLDIADRNAASNEVTAAASLRRAQAGAAGDGPSETDYMAAGKEFREAITMDGSVTEQQDINELADVMAQIRTTGSWKDIPNDTIINRVLEAHKNGTLPQVLQRLGIR